MITQYFDSILHDFEVDTKFLNYVILFNGSNINTATMIP